MPQIKMGHRYLASGKTPFYEDNYHTEWQVLGSRQATGATGTREGTLRRQDAPRQSNILGETSVDLFCSLKNMKYIRTREEIKKVSDEPR